MKKKIIPALKYILFLGIGVYLFYLAFKGNDISKMIADLKSANYFWIGVSLFLAIIAYVSRAYRWNLLIQTLGHKPTLTNSTYAICVGYFANLAIPRIGEVARCTVLSQVNTKIPFNKLFGTVILERAIDLICLIILLFLTVVLNLERFGNFFLDLFSARLDDINMTTILLLIALMVCGLLVLVYLFQISKNPPAIVTKLKSFLRGIFDGMITIKNMKQKWSFIFHTVLIWLLYHLMTYVCFFAIPATSHLTLVDGLFVLVLGGLGMTAPVQGGIGAYHFIIKAGLTVYGITEVLDDNGDIVSDPGLVFATIVHTSQTVLILVTGSISLIMISLIKRGIFKAQPQNEIDTSST